jgi:hypothetical protein
VTTGDSGGGDGVEAGDDGDDDGSSFRSPVPSPSVFLSIPSLGGLRDPLQDLTLGR